MTYRITDSGSNNNQTKARAINKRQIREELQESRLRWQEEENLISRVVLLENELQHPPTLLDLLCRFSRSEIDLLRARGLLSWLLLEVPL